MNKILKNILRGVLLAVVVFVATDVKAQDPQFSQFYAAPLYLNPSFAGTTDQHRIAINHRLQWPSLPNAYSTYAFSYDYNLPELNSGLGILATTDKAGSGDLRATNIGVIYSYKINLMNKWIVSPSVHASYGLRDLNFNKLVFGDQFDFANEQAPTLDPALSKLRGSSYFDFGTGLLAYNETMWAGVSVYHINEPDQSLIDEVSEIPMKISIHGGMRIPLYKGPFKDKKISSIAPSFVYKRQGEFDQLDVGMHFHYNPVMLGVWYRGIPVRQNAADNINQDAISVLMGLKFDKFDLGYSYDITTSGIGAATGGSHEISLVYQFSLETLNKIKPQKRIPCPTF